MANIMDYLVWRGDVPISACPWNDVDSLIAATLAYQAYPPEAVLLRDAAALLPPPPEMEINFIKEGRALLSAAGMTERFAALRIHRIEIRTDPERDMQFAAITIDLPDGTHYIAFRGTDNTIVGWREDFNMAFESPIPAQTAAADYLARAAEALPGPLRIGGHSKGGNLAIYAAAHAVAPVQDRILTVHCFDGPGLDDATMASTGYGRIAGRIRSYLPQSSVVGLLLTYHPEYTVVRSDVVGLMQHDCFTWQLMGTRFVEVPEVDVGSQLVNQTVHAWLSRVTPEQRRRFVDTLFDLLEATGASTMKELMTDVPGRATALLRALQKVDFDTARMIITLLGEFMSIGAQNILGLLRARRETPPPAITEGDTPHERDEE